MTHEEMSAELEIEAAALDCDMRSWLEGAPPAFTVNHRGPEFWALVEAAAPILREVDRLEGQRAEIDTQAAAAWDTLRGIYQQMRDLLGGYK